MPTNKAPQLKRTIRSSFKSQTPIPTKFFFPRYKEDILLLLAKVLITTMSQPSARGEQKTASAKFPFYFHLSCVTGLKCVSYTGIADGHRPVELNCTAVSTQGEVFDWLVGDASSLLGFCDPENEDTTVLPNIDKYLPMNTA
jgi:hypothetical protein